ncbi:hypothetical protein ULMS_22810 [Patiriisocius marinistellae]|uniref:Signal transduction histidine kinase internal region domain-containing protein n=1 Tax=Patiriisocius marinistellae TaxID=2494560 RepID=A0A5J4FXL9_9FLAO|nr:hypothetical protein ULMS_22810 [Patiriisocius marinistellae]
MIYYAVPMFLFKKKYLLFFVSTIPLILIAALVTSEIGPQPPAHLPRLEIGGPPKNLPSRFFVNLLILSISCVSAVLLETFIYAQQNEKAIAFAKAELMESELKFLKMQINPHFLFNALNNIYALSVINSEKTQESISTLSEMLRYVIYDCEQPKVPLKKELNYIINYIELFKLKSSKNFNISFTKNVIDENVIVAPMLFIPYIENAFKHSGIEKGRDNFISISLTQSEKKIEFIVENSNLSSQSPTDTQGGIGLPNVQKRLEILYPNKHILEISRLNVFKVYLKLFIE